MPSDDIFDVGNELCHPNLMVLLLVCSHLFCIEAKSLWFYAKTKKGKLKSLLTFPSIIVHYNVKI